MTCDHAGDLSLARACAADSAEAWERLVARLRGPLVRAVAHFLGDASRAEAVANDVIGSLALPSAKDGPPRIASYQGRASLESWARAIAYRHVVDLKREGGRTVSLREDTALEPAANTTRVRPELDPLAPVAVALRESLAGAIERLTDRDRVVLRLHFLEGLSLKEIGRLYRAHEATVSRWVTRISGEVHDAVLEIMTARHGIHPDDLGGRIDTAMRRAGADIAGALE